MNEALRVYKDSDAAATRAFYGELEKRGAIGVIALNLFRAQKTSTRAKHYHGGVKGVGSFRAMSYDRKAFSLENLCIELREHGAELAITYGWKKDGQGMMPPWVLYVDLPDGQVSFHSYTRYVGPDYAGVWDGQRGASQTRVIAFAQRVYSHQYFLPRSGDRAKSPTEGKTKRKPRITDTPQLGLFSA